MINFQTEGSRQKSEWTPKKQDRFEIEFVTKLYLYEGDQLAF